MPSTPGSFNKSKANSYPQIRNVICNPLFHCLGAFKRAWVFIERGTSMLVKHRREKGHALITDRGLELISE